MKKIVSAIENQIANEAVCDLEIKRGPIELDFFERLNFCSGHPSKMLFDIIAHARKIIFTLGATDEGGNNQSIEVNLGELLDYLLSGFVESGRNGKINKLQKVGRIVENVMHSLCIILLNQSRMEEGRSRHAVYTGRMPYTKIADDCYIASAAIYRWIQELLSQLEKNTPDRGKFSLYKPNLLNTMNQLRISFLAKNLKLTFL